jgi:hypothetical protein
MIDWEKYGFKEDSTYKGVYTRDGFPLTLWEEGGFLDVSYDFEYTISKDQIPATNQSVVLLLKAFNVPKNP